MNKMLAPKLEEINEKFKDKPEVAKACDGIEGSASRSVVWGRQLWGAKRKLTECLRL